MSKRICANSVAIVTMISHLVKEIVSKEKNT